MSLELPNLTGRRIDRYEVGAQLGQGGFGAVYRARHAVVGRPVALKVLWPDHARDPKQVERFLREARAAAAIGHPSIVRVHDAGRTDDGVAFLAMELLEGETLERRLRERGPLPVDEAVRVMGRVLAALEAAHAAGIVHRDLKPGNVFLTDGGEVKLLDFGISKIGGEKSLTATGLVLGTPQYMAPEQLQGGQALDGRVDLYSAATMLYELLSGEVPFPGQGYEVIVRRLKGERPPPLGGAVPDLPPGLVAVIERGLALDRDARFADVASFKHAIEVASEGGAMSLGELAVATEPPHASPLAGVATPSSPAPLTPTEPPAAPARPSPSPSIGIARTEPAASTPPASVPPPGPARDEGDGSPGWEVAAIGLLALLLASGLGVLGVLLYRLANRPSEAPEPSPSAAPVAPEPVRPDPSDTEAEPVAPVEVPAPTPPTDDGTEPAAPASVAPSAVRYEVFRYTGTGSRAAFDVVLERARPAVARCAVEGRPMHVAVRVVATLSGAITISQPHGIEPSDDDSVARCVAGAIQRAGPARFNPVQSAIAELYVDLPAG